MDSHHRHPVPETGVLLLNYPAKNVPGRNCTCDLKVRNLAFCLLNYGNFNLASLLPLSSGQELHLHLLDVIQQGFSYTTAGDNYSHQGDMHPSPALTKGAHRFLCFGGIRTLLCRAACR
jgi:hypothetical protein